MCDENSAQKWRSLRGRQGQRASGRDNKTWVMTHNVTPLDTQASKAEGKAGYKSVSEAVIISPFIFHWWQGQEHSNWSRLVQRQIVSHCLPYFIESAYDRMNSRTDYGSLLLTVLPESTHHQVIHHRLYPDHKSLFSKSHALDLGQIILFWLAIRRRASSHLPLWILSFLQESSTELGLASHPTKESRCWTVDFSQVVTGVFCWLKLLLSCM